VENKSQGLCEIKNPFGLVRMEGACIVLFYMALEGKKVRIIIE